MPNLRSKAKHAPWAVYFPGESIMFGNRLALLMQTRRRHFAAARQGPNLRKYPGIADRAPGDRNAVHAGLGEHVTTILGGKNIAAADDHPCRWHAA